MSDKYNVITCPTCGAEYLPVELYLPNEFFGKPTAIHRDGNHKIQDIVGTDMNTNESYICDYCNIPFRVSAKVQFNTKPEIKFDFDSEYSMSLKSKSLFLNED